MASHPPTAGQIELRVRELADEVFDPADLAAAVLTPTLKARSAAFLLLAHAEIETAIEQECRRTAALLRTAAEPATAMLAWGFASIKPDGSIAKPKKKRPLEELVLVYDQLVKANHGVKAPNLESLLTPLGFDLAAAKTDVLALDEFGARRGDLAHQPLASWPTVDLPSTHVRSGTQAAQSADRIITALQSSHSMISPTARRGRFVPWSAADWLRRAADILER